MTEYNIRINGQPVAQPRPSVRILTNKFAACAGLLSSGASFAYRNLRKCVRGQAYVPEKHPVHAWRKQIEQAARNAVWDQMTGPLEVRCVFLMKRPLKHPHAGRSFYDKKINDGDNLYKAALDAINDSKAWADDGQVVDGSFSRRYAAEHEQPGVEITIRPATLADDLTPRAYRNLCRNLWGSRRNMAYGPNGEQSMLVKYPFLQEEAE